jgi:effector-binding domain-containing protein
MIDPPAIVTLPARPVALIPLLIARERMPELFGPAVKELVSAVQAQRLGPAGPVFAHHLRIVPGQWDFEVGVPVSGPVKAAGRVKPGTWRAMRAARTVLHGGYEGLPGAWPELERWIAAQKLAESEDFFEVYTVTPETASDPADFRTELIRPLRD